MKKLLLGMFVLVSVSLSAQTMSGNWLVGGDAGFTSSTVDVSGAKSTSTIYLQPDLGYFIMDNLAVGASINFVSQSYDGTTSSQFGVGPAVRYYFANLGESAKLFGQAQITFGSTKVGDGDSVSSTDWAINAGLAWFLNHHVALEGALGYGSSKPGGTGAVATNTFGVRFGFQIHLGGE